MKLENLNFRDRFDILLEKRLSGVAELIYAMLYGKSQLNNKERTMRSILIPSAIAALSLLVAGCGKTEHADSRRQDV